ncbi:ORF6N domain-containing protein [Pedobacter psychrodurus]|uniref:ORF6N domain-containing protein n=1 Tax=Pedobacter psychrodurus TaxID=2530456 RepID=A0A4R0PKF3_9SPHI|nr:ORF6N domain-containing protein [Pedobacter psychrodurus]TCD17928.1 ORF6N domain-containing protein [Pedobacter psychrodurus]
MQIIKSIQNRIYEIRGERVMLDFDLAVLYEVETRVLNQAVKRNIKRFPDDFMFQLTSIEWKDMQSQIVTASQVKNPSSQFVMMDNIPQNRTSKYLPYAFTEQGVAMLSGVLKSDKAINMNIAIMRAFVDVRKILLKQSNLNEQLTEIKERIGEHDVQLNELYDAMENLIDEKIAQLKWNDRQRIGFKIKE